MTALEEEAVKALTGESQLDLAVVNGMLLKHRARLEECQRTMEEAKAKKEAEAENTKAAKAQVFLQSSSFGRQPERSGGIRSKLLQFFQL